MSLPEPWPSNAVDSPPPPATAPLPDTTNRTSQSPHSTTAAAPPIQLCRSHRGLHFRTDETLQTTHTARAHPPPQPRIRARRRAETWCTPSVPVLFHTEFDRPALENAHRPPDASHPLAARLRRALAPRHLFRQQPSKRFALALLRLEE